MKYKKLTVRLCDEDYRLLQSKSIDLGKSQNAFFREIIRAIEVDDLKEYNNNLKEILKLKRAISNNLNQLAKQGHYTENFSEIKKELDELWESLNQ